MSRSTLLKSRAEKGKFSSATPAVAHEIIPGKLKDQEWISLVDHDVGSDFVLDIVEDVCASALDIIYENYLRKQLIPFTVCQAKDAMLQIVEWQFLSRDVVIVDEKSPEYGGWLEDEEPEPSPTDCWAQGSVPTRVVRGQTPLPEEGELPAEEPECMPEMAECNKNKKNVKAAPQESAPDDNSYIHLAAEPEVIKEVEEEGNCERIESPTAPDDHQSTEKSRCQTKFKPYIGRLKSAGIKRMTESLEDTERLLLQEAVASSSVVNTPDPEQMLLPASCHSILKLQAGRPPGQNDVVFDDAGRVISMFRINPEKLPARQLKTRFKVIDLDVEAGQARLKAMRTGKYLADRKVPRPPDSKCASSIYTNPASPSHATIDSSSKQSKPYGVIPIAPPMINAVTVASGVVIREGAQIRIGPRHMDKNSFHNIAQNDLNPVCSKVVLPSLTVADLLEHRTPVIKPLTGNMPIPPIAQHVE